MLQEQIKYDEKKKGELLSVEKSRVTEHVERVGSSIPGSPNPLWRT